MTKTTKKMGAVEIESGKEGAIKFLISEFSQWNERNRVDFLNTLLSRIIPLMATIESGDLKNERELTKIGLSLIDQKDPEIKQFLAESLIRKVSILKEQSAEFEGSQFAINTALITVLAILTGSACVEAELTETKAKKLIEMALLSFLATLKIFEGRLLGSELQSLCSIASFIGSRERTKADVRRIKKEFQVSEKEEEPTREKAETTREKAETTTEQAEVMH